MKKYFKALGVVTACVSLMTLVSCHDEQVLTGGEGTVTIRAKINTDIRVKAKSTDDLAQNCLIHIYNPKGLVRRYNGINEVPAEGIKLNVDHYVAEAWAGDSVSASFEHRWFKGREEFDVKRGEVTPVDLTCKIANVVAAVEYGENIDEIMTDYTMTVSHKRGSLDFEGRDERWGYFMMPNNVSTLEWTLTATMANGEALTRTGVVEDVNPATLYTLKVTFNESEQPEIGAGYLSIEVDESELVVNHEVEIQVAPIFTAFGFDLKEPVIAEMGKVGRREIAVGACTALESFIIDCSAIEGIDGISGTDVDVFNASQQVIDALNEAGISWTYELREDGMSLFNLIFSAEMLDGLKDGDYDFNLSATDANGKTSGCTFKLVITNADVMANPAVDADVWATHATITANIMKSSATNPGFMYRKAGEQAWQAAPQATVNGNTYSVELTGLNAGTTYEYIAVADGYTSTDVRSFTTETSGQLPNASFESWHREGKIDYVYGEGDNMFWDTGNTGSSTLSVNVTTQATDKFHSGSSSIKLASQFVGIGTIGKFAAGNVFIGKYLDTVGTDGVLGWGRTWQSRPTAISGWMHYTPQAITHTKVDGVNKGDMDAGIIYVAILDDSTKEYNGSNFPVIVNTGTKELFDPAGANVIAYGELVITEATEGDAMVPFTVKLNYVRTDKKASNIMMVASASRYGDYFTGGPSVLYLDDLKLEY